MAQRVVRFEDNEAFDFAYQVLAAFPAGSREREAVASSAFKKLAAAGVPAGPRVGRFQPMTMIEENGPREVTLLESENLLVIEALKGFRCATFDVPFKESVIALFENARSTD